MTLQDAVGAVAAGLALGLALSSALIEWSPSDETRASGNAMPQVAAPMPEREPGSRDSSLEPGCGHAAAHTLADDSSGVAASMQPAYCPISSH